MALKRIRLVSASSAMMSISSSTFEKFGTVCMMPPSAPTARAMAMSSSLDANVPGIGRRSGSV